MRAAQAALASFPGVHFDDAALIEAQERFSQFAKLYPALARQYDIAAIQEQIDVRRADKTYEIARFYDKTGKLGAARYYYRATVANWPDTPAAAQSQGRLAVLNAVLEPDETQQINEDTQSSTQGGG